MKPPRRDFLHLTATVAGLPTFVAHLLAAIACAAIAILTCLGVVPGYADNRLALIIGNGAYVHAPHLPNPIHDAQDVAAVLKGMGFETIVGTDLDQNGMQSAAIRFARAARTSDVALFYYSGHAMQYGGINYLIPIDAELRDEADLRRMTRADEILADLQQAKNLRILVLDSCRDNPIADELKRSIGLTRGASVGRGLAKMESPDGTIISYSTQAGRTAEDGNGRNSPYTRAFLRHIEDKESVATVFRQISANVIEISKGAQRPELLLSFFGEFYLNGKLELTVAQPPLTPPPPPAPVAPSAGPLITSGQREATRLEKLAADQYKVAADRGDATAQVQLGFFYENGRGGLPKDDREAARLYKLAADQGNATGQNNLGVLYKDGRGGLSKDDLEALRLFKLAIANNGNSFARLNLGRFYRDGRGGLPQDDHEAARLFRLAADQRNATAQVDLGLFYERGRGGLPKDDRQAARLYKLAADQGSAAGQNNLGVFYRDGRGGLRKDDREAARLFKLAADQGNSLAQTNLANLYRAGRGGQGENNR
jgi:TPR repeat protein